MKFSCIIIDDEPNALHLLELYSLRLPFLELKGIFLDAIDALKFVKGNEVDVIISDINMPFLSGFELADNLSRYQKFIFVTAHAEHALSSFSYHVIDYLLKPITFKRFKQAVEKIGIEQRNYHANSNDKLLYMFVKTGRQLLKINFPDIMYIRGEKEYISIHLSSEKILVYKRMKEMESILPSEFRRVHVSYIVNIHCIDHIEMNQIFIKNERIPISLGYKKDFFTFLNGKTV